MTNRPGARYSLIESTKAMTMYQFPLNPTPGLDGWVIYSIRTTQPEWLAYLGQCELKDFHRLPDFWSNPDAKNPTLSDDFWRAAPVVTILGIYPTEVAAFDARETYRMNGMHPAKQYVPLSALTKKAGRKTKAVICNETGESFESASAACRAFGLYQSNMSAHLNGMLPRVGGYTFKYEGSGK